MPCVGSAPAAMGRAARHPQGCACRRAQFGSVGKAGQTRIGTHACQTRIGKGPGQIRIGNAGGSNPKREEDRNTKRKKRRGDAGFYQRLLTRVLTKVFTAPSKNLAVYLGLPASGFYLGKNPGRSPGAMFHFVLLSLTSITWDCSSSFIVTEW